MTFYLVNLKLFFDAVHSFSSCRQFYHVFLPFILLPCSYLEFFHKTKLLFRRIYNMLHYNFRNIPYMHTCEEKEVEETKLSFFSENRNKVLLRILSSIIEPSRKLVDGNNNGQWGVRKMNEISLANRKQQQKSW